MGLLDPFRNLFGGGDDGMAESVPGEDLRAEFRDRAAELTEGWPDADLDYSPDSLTRLDARVDDEWDDDRFRDAEWAGEDDTSAAFSVIVLQLGSYFGEVIVHNEDAAWVDDADLGAAVRVFGEEEDAVVNVFHVAAECLREDSKFGVTYETATAES